MRIGIHSTTMNPIRGNYPIMEAIASWSELADDIVIVDGGSDDGFLDIVKAFPKVRIIHMPWSKPYCREEFPAHINAGFDALGTDWAIKCDADYVFHENSIEGIRAKLYNFKRRKIPVGSFKKWVVLNRAMYHMKTDAPFAINKSLNSGICYGPALNKETDWCYPIFKQTEVDGVPWGMTVEIVADTGHHLLNYEYYFRTKEEARARLIAATSGFHGLWGKTDREAWDVFLNQVQWRLQKSRRFLPEDHPKWIRERAMAVSREQLGFNSWNTAHIV